MWVKSHRFLRVIFLIISYNLRIVETSGGHCPLAFVFCRLTWRSTRGRSFLIPSPCCRSVHIMRRTLHNDIICTDYGDYWNLRRKKEKRLKLPAGPKDQQGAPKVQSERNAQLWHSFYDCQHRAWSQNEGFVCLVLRLWTVSVLIWVVVCFQATAEANNLVAVAGAKDLYNNGMKQVKKRLIHFFKMYSTANLCPSGGVSDGAFKTKTFNHRNSCYTTG